MSTLPARPGTLWQEAKAQDGRVYYYNTKTKVTQWTKPAELLTPEERALQNQPYKEYKTPEGRPYWYNTQTKETTWVMPEAYKNALAQAKPAPLVAASQPQQQQQQAQQPQLVAAPSFVAGGNLSFTPTSQASSHKQTDDFRTHDRHPDRERLANISDVRTAAAAAAAAAAASNFAPEYSSFSEAQSAFMAMLKEVGVRSTWSWEETIRAAVKEPAYWALKATKDRKEAFKKYIQELHARETEHEAERQSQLQKDFLQMLERHPEISYFTRWTTARPLIEDEAEFRSARSEDERQEIFKEYRAKLFQKHQESEAQAKKAGIEALESILTDLHLEPYTSWLKASDTLRKDERFGADSRVNSLSKFDILKTFETHLKSLERDFNDDRQKKRALRIRTERTNRDRFIELLKELQTGEKIHAGTKWKDIRPLIENDERYIAMLGQAGSSPLELFLDILEEEERKLRTLKNDVLDVLEEKNFEVTASTTLNEFLAVLSAHHRLRDISELALSLVFSRLQDKFNQQAEEDKYNQERRLRKLVDNLRYRIKRLEPRVTAADTWADVRPRISDTPEFLAIEDESVRESTFEKVVRRLKDREDREDEDKASRTGGAGGIASRRDREPEKDRDGDRYYSHDYDQDRRDRERKREQSYRSSDRYSDRYLDRDRNRTRDREREGGERDRPRERERDRGDRYYERASGGGDRYSSYSRDPRDRDSRRTRSPEGSVTYDTDRRRASVHDRDRDRERDRDKHYLSDAASVGPPPSARRDYDDPSWFRERDYDRPRERDQGRGGRDDRDRSRGYHLRADPLEESSQLDYGDSKPTASSAVSVASIATGRKRLSEERDHYHEGDRNARERGEKGGRGSLDGDADERATKRSKIENGTPVTTATRVVSPPSLASNSVLAVSSGSSLISPSAVEPKSKQSAASAADPGGYHSGSEEGEIEED